MRRLAAKVDRHDVIALLGLLLLAAGLGGYSWQLAPITVGAGLLTLGIVGAQGGARTNKG